MASRGVRPASEHSRHPPSAAGEHGVSHRVHPTVDRMQPAERDAVLDRPRRQTELGKLLTSDDPVLAPSTDRDRPIHRMWADSPTYVVGNSAHAPRVAGNASQRTPETQEFSATPAAEHARGRPPPSMRQFEPGAAGAAGYRARPWEASSSAWPPPARRTRRRASWPASSPSSRSRSTRAI